jgi:hypothetical protein
LSRLTPTCCWPKSALTKPRKIIAKPNKSLPIEKTRFGCSPPSICRY